MVNKQICLDKITFTTHLNGLVHIQYKLNQAYQKITTPQNKNDFKQGLNLIQQTIQNYFGSIINEFKKLESETASADDIVQEAIDQKLTNLVQKVEAQLSNVSNWSRMMGPKTEDIKDMIKRVDHLSRLYAQLREYLRIPYINHEEANDAVNAERVESLIHFADFLDEQGAYALADKVTEVATLIKYAYIPKMRKADMEEEQTPPIQPSHEGSLSTRYCPDHHGVQAIRISERIYQCPIDGKTYNYGTGYINYQGQIVPGGSVAEQTPNTSDTGGIPMRFYDSRQSILNRIN